MSRKWLNTLADDRLKYVDFPLSAEARRYFKSGPSFLQRYLPFWIAIMIERLLVMCLPLVALLIPFVRFLPPLYQWRVRSRIYRWYRDILTLDVAYKVDRSPEQYAADQRDLDRIDMEVSRLSVPLAYADQLYNLQMHIELVRQRLQQAQTDVNREEMR